MRRVALVLGKVCLVTQLAAAQRRRRTQRSAQPPNRESQCRGAFLTPCGTLRAHSMKGSPVNPEGVVKYLHRTRASSPDNGHTQ